MSQSRVKAVRFYAQSGTGRVLDTIQVPISGVYTSRGQFRVVVQRHIDHWLQLGFLVGREDVRS